MRHNFVTPRGRSAGARGRAVSDYLLATCLGMVLALAVSARSASAQTISFGKSQLGGTGLTRPTSLQFGPDGRLYVAQVDGTIKIFTVARSGANSYSVTAAETVTLVYDIPNHDDDGTPNPAVTGRTTTGLLVLGTATQPILYVTSSDPRVGGGSGGADLNLDTNSGTLSRLTWNGATWDKLDLVRGLPRSEVDHATNGLAYDPATHTIFIAQGGLTNMGAPSLAFSFLPEYALSAAILSVDLDAIGETTYDLPTLDDPMPSRDTGAPGVDLDDPFGGNDGANQAKLVPGGPVQVYSPGYRNPYDIVITGLGRMYTIDNGPNAGWGDMPIGEGTSACTNALNEPGNTLSDNLQLITGAGFYAGHPNPTRASQANTFNGQSPVSSDDARQCDYLLPGIEDGALATFDASTDGLAEYTATNFGGAMAGDLLAASFSNNIYRIKMNASGTAATLVEPLFSSVGIVPLDVTAQGDAGAFPGTIWVADYVAGSIVVFEPAAPAVCTGAYDLSLDEDGDLYSNADEIDNGTNPCSAGDIPPDFDGDHLSDRNDPDDDNDGLPDTSDPFAIDPQNGNTTNLPVLLTWDNNAPPAGGLLNLGFTGLMTNGISDYRSLFNAANMTAGGAAGVCTIDAVPDGDAYNTNNTQQYGFQLGLHVTPSSGRVTVRTRILAPFAGLTPTDFQSMGLFIGTGDQSNYAKLVVSANGGPGGLQFGTEVDDVFSNTPQAGITLPGPDLIDLYLTIDTAASTVQPFYALGTAGVLSPITSLSAPVPIPPAWLTGPYGLAAGLIATSYGSGATFPATWDFLEARPGDAVECVDAASCDDANPCTDDACVVGSCTHTNNAVTCDDGLACTAGDVCSAGACHGTSACAEGESCNQISGLCEAPDGDPDNDGLVGAADPCPLQSRNQCYGPVAVDQDTGQTIRINANVSGSECSGTKIDCNGETWHGDFGFNHAGESAACNLNGGGEACVIGGIMTLFGCVDESTEDLFQCEHWDDPQQPELTYTFAVPNGTYLVNLLFANTYTGTTAVGERIFDISVEGQLVYPQFDQVAAAGGSGRAVSRSAVVTVTDGHLEIAFGHVVENPAIKAIEVLRGDDQDGDGYAAPADCNDADPSVHPGALDVACNGVDDNCNGQIDEGYVATPTECGLGACASTGTTACVNGVVTDSCAPGTPAASDDTCNGIDDNCNGTADEGYVATATACGVGACAATGMAACVNGTVTDSCAPGTPAASDDTCNGIDDNCNGETDEAYAPLTTVCGQGACGAIGVTACVAGAVQNSCTPGSPGLEVCDGVDNDCNGAIDDVPAPAGSLSLSLLQLEAGGSSLTWTALPAVTGYDVVRGDLDQLRTSGGNYAIATDHCLANDTTGPSLDDADVPQPGSGFFYLMRGENCGGHGSYDSGAPSQVGVRDPGISQSVAPCP